MMKTPEQMGHDYGKPLRDRTAIVTGSSSGIGAGIARAMAGAGANVIINYASSRDGAEKVLGTSRRRAATALWCRRM